MYCILQYHAGLMPSASLKLFNTLMVLMDEMLVLGYMIVLWNDQYSFKLCDAVAKWCSPPIPSVCFPIVLLQHATAVCLLQCYISCACVWGVQMRPCSNKVTLVIPSSTSVHILCTYAHASTHIHTRPLTIIQKHTYHPALSNRNRKIPERGLQFIDKGTNSVE